MLTSVKYHKNFSAYICFFELIVSATLSSLKIEIYFSKAVWIPRFAFLISSSVRWRVWVNANRSNIKLILFFNISMVISCSDDALGRSCAPHRQDDRANLHLASDFPPSDRNYYKFADSLDYRCSSMNILSSRRIAMRIEAANQMVFLVEWQVVAWYFI